MPLPWLRIIDGVLGATDLVRWVKGRSDDAPVRALTAGRLESRLSGVVMSALKDTFDRDRARLELEQQRADEERLRAERAMRLELLRQSGDREIGRQRLLAGLAVGSLIGTLAVVMLIGAGTLPRVVIGVAALLLVAAFASASAAQSRVARALGRGDDRALADEITESAAGRATPWFLVAGLATAVIGALIA